MDFLYLKKLLFKVAMFLLIVGGLNWAAIGAFQINLVERVTGRGTFLTRGIYILVGLCAIAVMFDRDTYLPFLGETVFPCAALPESIPENADTEVEVKAPAGAKVVYWAAEPATEKLKNLNDWKEAYLKYMNMGVCVANQDGVAKLLVRHPQPYKVPFKGRLEAHVHFRICQPDGFISRIKTVFLSDGRVEGFVDQPL
jgi:uncharacterized membrane protein YuzA (DUF378 family)